MSFGERRQIRCAEPNKNTHYFFKFRPFWDLVVKWRSGILVYLTGGSLVKRKILLKFLGSMLSFLQERDPKMMLAATVVYITYLHIQKMCIFYHFTIWISIGFSDFKWTSLGHPVLYESPPPRIKWGEMPHPQENTTPQIIKHHLK